MQCRIVMRMMQATPQRAPSAAAMRSVAVSAATSAAVAAPIADPEPLPKEAPKAILRADYAPPPYWVDTVHLDFQLEEAATTVTSRLRLRPNFSDGAAEDGKAQRVSGPPLLLNGRSDMALIGLKVAGQPLEPGAYKLTERSLTLLAPPPEPFELEVVTLIKPQDNTLLEGLYKSGGNYCTQCEAEGFRGITYFLDRPDVMARYTTRIEADAARYPVLLSNGNLAGSGALEGGRHYAVWEDPYPKPCYLFALVAGNLQLVEDAYTTGSGRRVALRIWTTPANVDKVAWAMASLKESMAWDERVFGLEYDLDVFNVVAVDDFNMGAMENKSLNIFNSRLLLASPDTSTDADYARIQGVVAHEYFHNWTGNRVTCRDWFQLTLKEGLTVFRDQEFSADLNSRPVKRIEDVVVLRNAQFSQDSGPMAHPIRPDSYIKMDNFYTVTVYEKGAEVIRLYHTLLGAEGFRAGMDLYFKRHDGAAVTCDDFLAAMADANDADLSGLATWYSQAGTPEVSVSAQYDEGARALILTTRQSTPPTNGQPNKAPALIPLKVGLLGPDGVDLPLTLAGSEEPLGTTAVLRVDKETNTFTFTNVPARPVPSLLRNFSAPVKLRVEGQTRDDLAFLCAHDSDPFNRWEAGQRLASGLLLEAYAAAAAASAGDGDAAAAAAAAVASLPGAEVLIHAFGAVLSDPSLDGSFQAMALMLPSTTELVAAIDQADPLLCHQVRKALNARAAEALRPALEAAVAANEEPQGAPYVFDAPSAARRAIKLRCLALLSTLGDEAFTEQLLARFRAATNMTDRAGALSLLADTPGPQRTAALEEFYESAASQPLNLLKWLRVKAASNVPGNVAEARALLGHPSFSMSNPNSCYSLMLGFASSPVNFHAPDGSGYEFLADTVLQLDGVNHQVAARVAGAFTTYRQYDARRQALMRAQLERLAAASGLSENVYEIVAKSLE